MLFASNLKLRYVFLFTIVLAFYSRTLQYGFIWDDFSYIVNSPILGQGTNFFDLWTAKITVDFWPLTYSFLWVLKYCFGINPVAYHFVNILLFGITGLLIFHLLTELKLRHAFLITVLFCVHPMNVSAVSWVFQVKTHLANIFGLLSAIYFFKFVDGSRKKYYCLALLFLTLSFLSKIPLIMLPCVYLLIWYSRSRKNILHKLQVLSSFFVTSFVFGLANIFWEKGLGFVPVPVSEMILDPNPFVRLALLGQNFLFYLCQSYLPLNLMFVHPKIDPDIHQIQTYIPTAMLFLFLLYSFYVIFIKKAEKIPAVIVCFLISLFLLIPILGFVEVYFMRFSFVAEHYLMLALIGFLIPAVNFLAPKSWGRGVLAIFIFFLSYQSWTYTPEYVNEKTLFESSLLKNPNDILAHNVLGLLYKNENNFYQAITHYNQSIVIHPTAAAYYNKAVVLEKLNQLDAARDCYEKSIQLNPFIATTYSNLGVLYLKLKNFKVALDYLFEAHKLAPQDSSIIYNIGYAFEINHEKAAAQEWYLKALTLKPSSQLFSDAVQSVSK